MAAIEDAALAIIPAAARQPPQHGEVLHIRHTRHDDALLVQQLRRLAQHAPGIDEMFEHIGEDETVERSRLERQPLLAIAGDDTIETLTSLLGLFGDEFQTGDVMTALNEESAESAGPAADFEDASMIGWDQGGDVGT